MQNINVERLFIYMSVAFLGAFCTALALVPALTSLAVTKAVIAGGAAAGLAGKAFLDRPDKVAGVY